MTQESFHLDPMAHREKLLDSWLALTAEGPNADGVVALPVLSGSMLPKIPVNSIIHIKKTGPQDCSRGDVVVYRDGDRLIAHRLLWSIGWRSAQYYFEKGDSNKRGGWIRGQQIVGLVVAVVPDPDNQQKKNPVPITRQPNLAAKSLRADFFDRTLALPRRIKNWIFR